MTDRRLLTVTFLLTVSVLLAGTYLIWSAR